MKSIVFVVLILFFVKTNIAQNNGIKVEQLFITNGITGKSVKLFSNEETLKNFGDLLNVKINDLQFTTEDYAKSYIFSNIMFNVSTQGKISSFNTSSPDIVIEKKGEFSISVGATISEIGKYFPDEASKAHLIDFGQDRNQYLLVNIPLLDYHPSPKQDVEIDFALWFLLNPTSKKLERIYLWIRP